MNSDITQILARHSCVMRAILIFNGGKINHSVGIQHIDNNAAAEAACMKEVDTYLTEHKMKLLPIHIFTGDHVQSEIKGITAC